MQSDDITSYDIVTLLNWKINIKMGVGEISYGSSGSATDVVDGKLLADEIEKFWQVGNSSNSNSNSGLICYENIISKLLITRKS